MFFYEIAYNLARLIGEFNMAKRSKDIDSTFVNLEILRIIQYKNQNGKTHESQVMPLALVQQGASTYLVARYDGFEDNRLLA